MGESCFPQGEGRQLWVRDSALRLKDQLSCPLALQSNGLKLKQSFFVFFLKKGAWFRNQRKEKGSQTGEEGKEASGQWWQ